MPQALVTWRGRSTALSSSPTAQPSVQALPGRLRLPLTHQPQADLLCRRLDPDGWKRVSNDLVRESGVNLRLHSWFSRPVVRDGTVKGVVCETKSGRRAAPHHDGPHPPGAGRRRGADHPVELPDRHPRLEAGAGADQRQRSGAEARRAHPALHPPLTEALVRAGLPAGVLNVVHGTGAVVGEALVRDPRVAAVSFTGSTAVGMRIERASGAPRRGAGRDGRQERPWWCWTTPTSSRPRGSARRAAAASPARPAPPPPG